MELRQLPVPLTLGRPGHRREPGGDDHAQQQLIERLSNTVTGLGSPIGSSLVSGLVTSNLTVPLTTTSGSSLQSTNGPPSPLHPKGRKQHRPVRHGHNKPARKTHAAVHAGHKLVAQGAAAHGLAATRHGLL